MSFTYAQLKQAIQDFTDNSETSLSQICLFLFVAQKIVSLHLLILSCLEKMQLLRYQMATLFKLPK